MSNKKSYNKESIQSLSPLEFTRLRPGVYVGDTTYSTQLLIEVISNAIDEYVIGNCTKIKIDYLKDNWYQVEDNGQGFLINQKRKEDNLTVLEAAFGIMNTSGKYTDDGVYQGTALGLNGLGCKITNFLSHKLEVISYRDKKYEHIWFEEGKFQKRECGKWLNAENAHGTLVMWQPNEEFFEHPEIEEKKVEDWLFTVSCLCPGLEIILNGKSIKSTKGLDDYIDKQKKMEIIKNRFKINYQKDKYKLDLLMTYTTDYSTTIIPYVNLGLTEQGPHLTQIKTLLTKELNKFFRDKGWLKEKDNNLSGEDCQEGMFLVFNLTTTGVSYDAQIKSRIVKLDMKPFTSVIIDELRQWCTANEKDLKIIVDKALAARKAREAAKKAREAAREPKKEKGLKAKMAISNKFIDCSNKNPKERNLLLVEG